jgi:transcription elongation factor Elf1
MPIIYRTKLNINCPFCAHERPSHLYCLGILYPEILDIWDYEANKNTPYEFLPNSNETAWFICKKCNKNYDMNINDKTSGNQGCPYCAGKRVCEFNSLATLYPEIATEWHPTKNKNLIPNDVTYGSHKKVWWLCNNCNKDFYAIIVNRTKLNAGCTHCHSSSKENKCKKLLENYTQKSWIKIKPKWLKNKKTNGYLELDGFCEELSVAFEYNGEQHYHYVKEFHKNNKNGAIEQKQRDKIKVKLCKQNNIKLIVIPYWINNLDEFILSELKRLDIPIIDND